MSNPLVLFDLTDNIALITLNRPEAMNAMSRDLRVELVQAIERAGALGARAIVLTGAGDRAFTAGLDLKEISADPQVLAEAVMPDSPVNPVAAIARCTCPVIAAINGVVITGGLELALACDMMLASDNARFADTHAAVGVLPGWGLSQKLSRLIGPGRAREMHFSARQIDAATAQDWGLVNRTVPLAELLNEALGLARDMAAHEPDNLSQITALVREGWGMALDDAMALEAARSHENYQVAQPVNLVRK
ncbi:MAG: enoyl-CoA hydratase [Rhodobacteraceae bacterium]|nr:enoyl-CoA hydratase [Paracoccaceae bacterium]